MAVWHRRAGKDDLCLHWTATAAHEKIGSYWHMLPQANQARKAIWDAINPKTGKRRIDEAFPAEIRESTRESDMFIRFKCGSTWQVVGSDNFDSLIGTPPIGLVFSEYSVSNPLAWAYLMPILEENGGWALFIYTARGRNHGHALYELARESPDWYCEVLTPENTGVFQAPQLERIENELKGAFGVDAGEALFLQEYWCSFDAAIIGAYWGREMLDAERSGRITDVPVIPGLKVHTAWDIGTRDATSIWFFQVLHGGLHIIDYYERTGQGVPHFAEELRRRGYDYGSHYVPHDARVLEWGSGRTRIEAMLAENLVPSIVANHQRPDGIDAARQTIPLCKFDAKRCKFGIEALKQYRAEYDEERKILSKEPLHDWTSHAADAFRYLSMAWRAMKPEPPPPPKPVFEYAMTDDGSIRSGLTMKQIIERQTRRMNAED